MATDRRRLVLQAAGACLCLASLALADPKPQATGPTPPWWTSVPNGNGGSSSGSGSGSSSGSGSGTNSGSSGNGNGNTNSNNPFGNFGNGQNGFSFLNFDIQQAMYIRAVHGVLASVAFVILFPIGSILMRVVPGRFALWLHVLTQVVALILYIAGAGLGFWLINTIRIPFQDGTLLSNPDINYHPIIGIVVLAMLLFQPILGYIHHAQFKKLRTRQIWSHLHLWNGRLMITLGIINGGLGLLVARASNEMKTAYTVVSAIMWAAWFLAAIFGECRRTIGQRRERRARRKELQRESVVPKVEVPSESSVAA